MTTSTLKDRLADTAQRLLRPVAPLIRAANLWMDVDGPRMSAAMSFYGMLSLAPLLLLLVGVLGWWIDKSYLETNLITQVQSVVGDRGADVIRAALASAQAPSEGRLASIFGFVLLLSGATGVFVELQSALERLWTGGKPAPQVKAAWWRMASLRLRGLGYVMAIGFLLLISLVVSTGINMVSHWATGTLPEGAGTLLLVVNELVAFGIAVGLFVGLMRIGGGPKPSMTCLVFGAVVGAILFTVGKQLLAFYLSTAAVVSAYGAAGSLVVLLMWIFFSSAVLLFAAACARALQETREEYAKHAGLQKRQGEAREAAEQARTA
ncbi:YihY/virulence factor BrkB family protein [Paracidovorax wautersii]|uniref:YihY/virulence factor BrkB family protein n=1 Tax=Paracidovorax wautersii TaxID=1177982 RepID=UPI0031E102AC